MVKAAFMALLLVLGWVAGCEPEARYCARCETRAAQEDPDRPARLIRGQCTINGVAIDCRKFHPACPDCAK